MGVGAYVQLVADMIEGGPPDRVRPGRRWVAVGVGLAVVGAAAVAVMLPRGGWSPTPTRPGAAPSSTPSCTDAEVFAALSAFVDAWNSRGPGRLAGTLAPAVELDMSQKGQRASPPAVAGGFRATQGIRDITAFAQRQWDLGERFSYVHARIAPGGVYAERLVARFDDGSRQPMAEAKFAYDCGQAGFSHIVIMAAQVAGRPRNRRAP